MEKKELEKLSVWARAAELGFSIKELFEQVEEKDGELVITKEQVKEQIKKHYGK